MRIGMVCPYSLDVPGGVQAHVLDLARVLIDRGHEVSVLAPSSPETPVPDFVVSTGPALAIPYNGSVSRVNFGPRAYRTLRSWVRTGRFEVLHVHEPNSPSISMLALKVADGPIVATFHTSITRSLTLSTFGGVLRPFHERISGKIAVSELARRWQMEALGSDAVEIPNGVDVDFFRRARPLDGYPRAGRTIAFLGRFDESRKGMDVLVEALPWVVERYPDLEILVIGGGGKKALRRRAGENAKRLRFLGQVDDEMKAAALASADVYCAPNIGGESFGIVLVEAMATGTPVVAAGLDAFRRVLDDGGCGVLTEIGDARALAAGLLAVLDNDEYRDDLVAHASARAWLYDWSTVADQVLRVYETVTVGTDPVRVTR